MKKLICYNDFDLPSCIDEIEIGTKIGCRMDDGKKFIGKLIKNNSNNIEVYNDNEGKSHVKKQYIKELRVEIDDDEEFDNMYIGSQDKVKMIMKYDMCYEDIKKLDITAKKVCNILINEWYSKKLEEKVIFVTEEIIKGLVHEYEANNFNDIQVSVVKYKDFLLKRR
jgi:hypothetical protein